MEVSQVISPTSRVVVCHMVVAYAALGLVNASVLRTIRRLPSHTLQEKIARSLLIPLAVGDVIHQFGSFYGIGDVRWKMEDCPQALRLNAVVGIVLFVTRSVRAVPTSWEVTDVPAECAGSWASVGTLRLAIAFWTAGIDRSSRMVVEEHMCTFRIS